MTIDWQVLSELATGIGTLVLAAATYSSVRTANRDTELSRQALLRDSLPLLVPSRLHDPEDKITFADDYWVRVKGGHGYAEATDSAIYFVISVRNAGQGLTILDRWQLVPDDQKPGDIKVSGDLERQLRRDLYIASGDTGLWQGAIRETDDHDFARATELIKNREHIIIDIQYSDQSGGQTTVSRFNLAPVGKDDYMASIVRHQRLDGTRPR